MRVNLEKQRYKRWMVMSCYRSGSPIGPIMGEPTLYTSRLTAKTRAAYWQERMTSDFKAVVAEVDL